MPAAWGFRQGTPWLLNPRRVRRRVSRRRARVRGKRLRRNVAVGFYDDAGSFHPVRWSHDYDPVKAGERRGSGQTLARKKLAFKRWKKRHGSHNPLGEGLVILGAGNPHKGGRTMARRRRKTRGSYRRRHHRHNPHRRMRAVVRHRRHFYGRRRHHRRNPSVASTFGIVRTALPLMGTGAAAMIATVSAPAMLGVTDRTYAYLTQAATALAGYIGLPWVGLRGMHPTVWLIVSGSTILGDVVGKYLKTAIPGLHEYRHPGLAEYYWPPALTPYGPGGGGVAGGSYPGTGGTAGGRPPGGPIAIGPYPYPGPMPQMRMRY